MNPWGVLYECLHSALIDVLNREFAGTHPELGLPQSGPEWNLPSGLVSRTCTTLLTPSQLISPGGKPQVGLSCLIIQGPIPAEFWNHVLKVATSGFEMRIARNPLLQGMKLQFERTLSHEGFPEWPMERRASRLVWTPVGLAPGKSESIRLFLGLAL